MEMEGSHFNKIEPLMRAKELTDDQLCEITGLSKMTLWNAKRGKNVTLETMKKISRALGESIFKVWPEEVAA